MPAQEIHLSPQQRRAALQGLDRNRLSQLTEQFGLEVEDRRVLGNHVNALVRSRSVDFAEVLGQLKREELQAICDALGLDRGGREKEVLIRRILGFGEPQQAELGLRPPPPPAAPQKFLRSRVHPGATVDRILLTDFPSYPVLCPPPELIQRFDDFAGPIWSRIHANMAENQTLAELRDTLLPKLLSGEIRIKDAEKQAGATL